MSTVTWIKCKTDNCYLVSDGKDAFLVDTGSAVSYDKVLEECSKYNMKLIVLTHTHFDHAENAAKLSKHFGIPVACHEADVELFESFDKQPMESYGIVGKVVLGTSLKVLRQTKVEKPDNLIFIKDGDDLSAYGFDAKIIGLPGHTKGSVTLITGEYMFTGDTLFHLSVGRTDLPGGDREELKTSINRLIGRDFNYKVLPGHGEDSTLDFEKRFNPYVSR